MDVEEKQKHERRHARALKLLKEALSMATDIRDYSEYRESATAWLRYWVNDAPPMPDDLAWPNKSWDSFKIEFETDALLLIQLNNQKSPVWIETPLIDVAIYLLSGTEKILDAPNAKQTFKIESSEDRENGIDNAVRQVLLDYMTYVPAMLSKAMDEAFKDCLTRYVKKSVEPELREHWKAMGLPSDHDVLAAWEFSDVVKDADELRKLWSGEKRPPIPESLPQIYDELRADYVKARRCHRELRKIYVASNSEQAWNEHWKQNCQDFFPKLVHSCLTTFSKAKGQKSTETCSELAHRHLGYVYMRSADYMKKKVTELRALARIKSRRVSSKKRDIS